MLLAPLVPFTEPSAIAAIDNDVLITRRLLPVHCDCLSCVVIAAIDNDVQVLFTFMFLLDIAFQHLAMKPRYAIFVRRSATPE